MKQEPNVFCACHKTVSFGERFIAGSLWFVLSLAATASSDPILGRVRFEGDLLFPEPELHALADLKEGAVLSSQVVRKAEVRVLERYRATGRLFAEVNAQVIQDTSTAFVTFTIHAGPRARLASLDVIGVQTLPQASVSRALGVRAGSFFDAARWERGTRRLAERYQTTGYPFVALTSEVVSANPTNGDIRLMLHVDEGPRVSIESLEFEGLSKTRETTIRRSLPIRSGDLYDSRRIESARHVLVNSGFFSNVHPLLLRRGSAPDRVVFRARVEEGRTGRVAGLLGYAPPRREDETPQLTGLIEAEERNLLGTGRSVAFRWESAENRATHVAYREPFTFGLPIGLGFQWDAQRIGEFGRQTGLLRADWELSPYIQIEVGGQIARTSDGFGWGALASASLDTRDYRPNPSRGWFVQLRGDRLDGSVQFSRLDADVAAFRAIRSRHVLALRFRVGKLVGEKTPLTEQYVLGGAATLRGYREREFLGLERLLTNVEYRVLTGWNSRVFAFVDIGRARGFGRDTGTRIGYGFGTNLESRGGIVRLDYGLSRDVSPLNGRIHIQLGTAF